MYYNIDPVTMATANTINRTHPSSVELPPSTVQLPPHCVGRDGAGYAVMRAPQSVHAVAQWGVNDPTPP